MSIFRAWLKIILKQELGRAVTEHLRRRLT